MSRSPSRTIARRAAATAALALAATLAAAAPWPWRFGYSPGAPVGVHGTIADGSGRPLAGLEVALEASNPHFDWRTLTEVPGEVVRHAVRSGADGAFALDWSWDPRMRRFEVVVSLDETLGSRTLHAELTRLDVTDRLAHGTPVAAALVVEDAQRVARLRAFLAGVRSEDEKRVWEESGLPESVDTTAGPAVTEVAWWYFAAGRVARFRDGRLVEVESFPPVGTRAGGGAR